MEEIRCPTCGKTGFSTKGYMKRHHKLKHDESLRKEFTWSAEGCENRTFNPKYCSEECMGKDRRQYESAICKNDSCETSVYKKTYCSCECANRTTWKNRNNPAKRQAVRQKISEAKKGDTFNMPEEAKEKISRAMSGENHPLYGKTGEDHPKYGKVSGLKRQKVAETGHVVRSNWEKQVDLLLHRSDLLYEYEPETFALSEELTYTPDFILEDKVVLEVKGWPDELSKRRARTFLDEEPNYTYVVVGNKVPCDIFIPWTQRETLAKKIKEWMTTSAT